MSLSDRIAAGTDGLLVSSIVAMGSGAVWLIRRVFTNQKQIEMLSQEIHNRDQLRLQDSERLTELHTDVRELRSWMMDRDK